MTLWSRFADVSDGASLIRASLHFTDESSANAYLGGEIVSGMKKQPTIKDISAKLFDVEEALTQKTRGPIKVAAAA